MSKGLEKKISKLEDKVLPDVEKGSTRLACLTVDVGSGPSHYLCLDIPEIEAQLQHKAYDIGQRYANLDDPQMTPEHRKILQMAGQRTFTRTLDLFENAWGLFFDNYVEGDKLVGMFFRMRLYWFINEMFRHAELLRKEGELEKKYPRSWKRYEKAFKKWERQRENKARLWTRESFSHFIEPAFRKFKESKRR